MNLSSFHALLVAAASLTAHASANFKVTPGSTTKASTSKHVNYVKQWTLTAGVNTDSIDAIDLSLAGNAYVSYVSGLPTDVIGYVNVSGDSRAVVDAVTVSKDVDNDDLFDNDNNGEELNVWIDKEASSGYLLTEIFLAVPNAVTDLKSQRSAQVVVEDGVLVATGKRADLQIEASGSSAVFISSPETPVSVRQLSLESTGTASIEYSVDSVSVRSELQIEAQGSSNIAVLSSSIETSLLDLDATGSICISADTVASTTREIVGKSKISLPNSSKKHGTTGTDTCEESILPARKAAKITAATFLDDEDKDDLNDFTDI